MKNNIIDIRVLIRIDLSLEALMYDPAYMWKAYVFLFLFKLHDFLRFCASLLVLLQNYCLCNLSVLLALYILDKILM